MRSRAGRRARPAGARSYKHGRWTIILCAGDEIRSDEALRHAGIAPDVANALVQALAKAEETVPADRLAMFARFEGLLRMDEAGNHPPGS